MMYSAMCPKCGSKDIVRVNGYVGSYGEGNNMNLGAFAKINVNRYICCNCGYSEEWIDPEDIPRILRSKKAMRVGNTYHPSSGFNQY